MDAAKAVVLPCSALVFAVLLAACGPAPQAAAPAEPPVPQTVYVIVGEPPPDPEVAGDAWLPEDPPIDNPFARFRSWSGEYECPQGTTDLTVKILSVQGPLVRAVFEFDHAESGASGSYLIAGAYDPASHRMTFAPGAWLRRPEGYVPVGMTGDVAEDASLFAGRIDYPACGSFRLRPAR